MRNCLLYVLTISFVFLNSLAIQASEEPHITLRSSYSDLSLSQVHSISNISISLKHFVGFDGHSTINHNYDSQSINGNSVVIDSATGSMWHQSGSDEHTKWNHAKDWIRSLNSRGYAGYLDWRLPTLEEAASLLESSKSNGLYIDSVFSNKQEYIWTGDKDSSEAAAWGVDFDGGGVANFTVSKYDLYVRPVRSLK